MELGKIHVDDATKMATIVAQLVREGVTFDVKPGGSGSWVIVLTGGF